MSTEQLQVIAGMISTLIFIFSNLPMLYKAFRTHEMGSYSFAQITLSNVGNLIYWLYIAGLPVGPVWVLHGFFTLATVLMLIFYLRYEKGWGAASSSKGEGNPRYRWDTNMGKRQTSEWQI
jgi:uncharacterized protein with PQ loop repeat